MTLAVCLLPLGGALGAPQSEPEPGPLRTYAFPTGWSTSPTTPDIPLSCRPYNFPLPDEPNVCRLGRHFKHAPTIVLWGDSHAWQQVPALEAAIGKRRVNLDAVLLGGCPPLYLHPAPRHQFYPSCTKAGKLAVHYIRSLVSEHRTVRVVVAEAWQIYHGVLHPGAQPASPWVFYDSKAVQATARLGRGTSAAFDVLGRLHVPTDVVGPTPMAPLNAPRCAVSDNPYACSLPRRLALRSEHANLQHIRQLMTRLSPSGRLIQPSTYLCGAAQCRGLDHGHPVYWDLLHLSALTAARYGKRLFGPTVAAVLTSARSH